MSVKCKERTSQAHGHHPISKLSRPFLHAKGRDSQGRMETNGAPHRWSEETQQMPPCGDRKE